MSEQRRQRYQSVLYPLARLPRFRRSELADLVHEEPAAFITRTVNEVVKAGVLETVREEGEIHFEWVRGDRVELVDQWIDRRIHGDQVKEQPERERPRERLMRLGPTSLSDAELLAILIRVGVVGESAVTGGQKLANRFAHELDLIRNYGLEELRKITPAVTKASFCQILAALELGKRATEAARTRPVPITKITSTIEATQYCAQAFAYLAGDAVQEEFHIVTLDTKHKPIRTHKITVGTLDSSLVHPREVFRPAIRDSAAAVLLVHNHPSGDPTPSREDHAVTERLTEAGKLIGIGVLDHIIVARERCQSLREC
ncbi:DNA repair protein RadC [Neorhodopirellula lusitana]|uniref:DNA repair protein RadC n=1 Tax=Neorhodopirellula lusitana TaxID=445327 RepID=A0ABY1QNH8_9BACT|nr:DNA repair protein RadC [Neorhodopirellula lusitana]SMP74745.1 DNA repair protein RadC [Neorhodopirellula lusitana]